MAKLQWKLYATIENDGITETNKYIYSYSSLKNAKDAVVRATIDWWIE